MDRDESRYAQSSRQMMETGDYLNIRFQEYDRHKQPAGAYWLQSLFAQPFGGAEAPIGAHRLPGFVFALLAVAITGWLGARMFSPSVGLAAGLVLATTLVLSVEARTAKTDAILLGVGMIAQAALMILMVEVKTRRPRFWGWPAAMWGALGVSLLVKGPIFFMVTALTLCVFAAWKRDPALLLRVRPLPGIALALAIFTPWFIAINLETNWAFALEAIGHSMLGKVGEAQEAHSGPLGFHIGATALTLWPGVALLGLGLLGAWRFRDRDEVKFLIAWIVPTYVVFEIVATKLPHYTLPAFPAIAILIGLALANAPSLLVGARSKALHWSFAGLAALVGLVLSLAPFFANRELGEAQTLSAYLTMAFGAIAAAAILGLAARPSVARLFATGVAAAAMYSCVFAVALPAMDRLWTSQRLSVALATLEGCERLDLTVAGYREPSLAFNLGTQTWLAYDGADAARELVDHPRCGVAIVDAAWEADFLGAIHEAEAELRSVGGYAGYNSVRAEPLALTFYTLDGSDVRRP
jgi:4-amino-4-deoxy-L-arabinose transferase-like glycosyltransferase